MNQYFGDSGADLKIFGRMFSSLDEKSGGGARIPRVRYPPAFLDKMMRV